MSLYSENIADIGMDTISLSGTLPIKLRAVREAGFSQIMLMARDLTGHAEGVAAAIQAVRDSGLRVTGFQVLRDFEGLSGNLHAYKIDIAKSMLEMCAALGSKLLLVCSSTSIHASDDRDILAKDLRKLAMLALPLDIKIAYEGLSWGGMSTNSRTPGTSSAALMRPIWDLASILFTFSPLRLRSMKSTRLTRGRFFWFNWPTSCGRRSGPSRSALIPPAPFEYFPVRACTARNWQSW